ncbi:MAG: hypothetical protein IOD12_06770 [Silvanigrellales bacterium]|nr:hypothetical protein [Silvanigrellales bacterium]
MNAKLPAFPRKKPDASPFVVRAELSPRMMSRSEEAPEANLHHSLQMKCWNALECFADRVANGELSALDEPSLVVALDTHLTSVLCGSHGGAAGRVWWHPIVVKADAHTLVPGVAHKALPGCVPKELVVLDVGIVLDGLEIDCGLSVGFTAEAKKLAHEARELTSELIAFLKNKAGEGSECSPAAAFVELQRLADARHLTQVAASAGHRTGPYPTPKRDTKIRADDPASHFAPGPWMVEVHVVNASGRMAAFYEDCFYVV